ncbi:MAG: RNA polymerase sigma factor, partial [Thermoguttaceae bacterium]
MPKRAGTSTRSTKKLGLAAGLPEIGLGQEIMNVTSQENKTTPVDGQPPGFPDTEPLELLDRSDVALDETLDRAPSPTADKRLIRQEKKLVDRCVRGDVGAWEELYQKHPPPLLRSIAVLLGPKGTDRNLVDELAAQVWYSLVDQDGQLLGRFCPKRGARLNTFIRAVAKDVTSRYFRAEQRR